MDDKIKRVRELDGQMSPRPWRVVPNLCGHIRCDCPGTVVTEQEIAVAGCYAEAPRQARLDTAGIAEYRTLAPALADELEAARKEVEKLRACASHRNSQPIAVVGCSDCIACLKLLLSWKQRDIEDQWKQRDAERARADKAEAELAKERERAARLEESMRRLAEQIATNTHPDEVHISSPARHIMGQRILLGLDQWRRES